MWRLVKACLELEAKNFLLIKSGSIFLEKFGCIFFEKFDASYCLFYFEFE